MKKAFFLVVITTAFALSSFAEKSIQPLFISPELYGPAFPYNDSYLDNYDGVVLYDECTNELITLSGSLRVMFHGVYNGEKTTSIIHFNAQGIKGTGESGREYHPSATENIRISESYNNGVYSYTEVSNQRWTTAGGGNNITFRSTYAFTIDANGNTTVTRQQYTVYCQ